MSRKVSISKHAMVFVFLLASCLISASAQARCQRMDSSPQTLDVVFGTLSVAADVPIGAVLKVIKVAGSDYKINCDIGGYENYKLAGAFGQASDANGIFDSGVAGVGYKIYSHAFAANAPHENAVYFNAGRTDLSTGHEVSLIKTGPITSGPFATSFWGFSSLVNVGVMVNLRVPGGGINVAACDAIGMKTIDLGRLSATAIDSGTSTGDKVLGIAMNCNTGFRIFARLTGTAPPGSTAAGLIRNSGSAAGVAVQLIDGDKHPIRLGAKIGQANDGASTIYKIGARAYRIGAVAAGTIRAQATLSMTYE